MRYILGLLTGVVLLVSVPPSALAATEYSSTGTFGSEGSGAGQFSEPNAIALNESSEPLIQSAAGDVYVADSGNQRIERFSATGEYLSQWDGSATAAKSFSLQGFPKGLAVDNSSDPLDPSAGDVYVANSGSPNLIDQFSAEGTFTGLEITGTCAAPGTCPGTVIPFSTIVGIAVDSHGALWVIEENGTVDEFSGTGGFIQDLKLTAHDPHWLQVGPNEELFTRVEDNQSGEDIQPVVEFSGSEALAQFGTSAYSFGVDFVSGEVFAGTGLTIERFGTGEAKTPVEVFGLGELEPASYAMAVSGASPQKTVYAVQRDADKVAIFNYGLFPTPVTIAPSQASETGMRLQGTVNPAGVALTECRFEYGTTSTYGQSIPCQQSLGAIGEGSSPVFVSATLSGLAASATRHFRLVVANANGTKYGKDGSVSAPELEGASASNVGPTGVTIDARVAPGGLPATYHLEYGTSASYGSNTPELSAGAGSAAVSIHAQLSGLQPGTVYHARLVVSNEIGTAASEDLTFTTSAKAGGSTSPLPDDRAYELVSTANENDVYFPDLGIGGQGHEITSRPFRASQDGVEVTYLAEPPAVGGSGSQGVGEQFLAKRTSNGWADSDIVPPGAATETQYEAFSSDLSTGILERGSLNNEETADAAECDELIAWGEGGELHPFFTEQRPVSSCGESHARPYFAGASVDYSHLLLESQAALTEGAEQATEPQAYNLYDSIDGHLQLVNVLPGPNPPADPNATFGGPRGELGAGNNPPAFSNAISADGSKIFWTALSSEEQPEALYVRENDGSDDATTVQVDAPRGGSGEGGHGQFWTASSEGSRVFFTDHASAGLTSDTTPGSGANLYMYDTDDQSLVDLTGNQASAHVEGVLGASEDGSYLYFVAASALSTATNENANGETAQKGAEEGSANLYVWHEGATSFIASLSPNDNAFQGPQFGDSINIGDWMPNLGDRTAEVAPAGQTIAFLSHAKLTGYDNRSVAEAYVYDAETGQLSCASCGPAGAPAVAEALVPTTDSGNGNTYMERWLSDDGSRVFFDSAQPLVPQANDGKVNLYEWERDGVGSCLQGAGCIYLLSGGSSREGSYFVDASASGDDVFFTSREDFVLGASGEAVKLYDARVGGGFPETSTACTGTGCQGVPPAPPSFATPSTVTFNGTGNFPSSPPTVIKSKSTAETRAGKLSKALQHCRKDRSKARRRRCEASARKQYGAAKKGKTAKDAKITKRSNNDRRAS